MSNAGYSDKPYAITAPLLRTTGTRYDLVRKESGVVAATRHGGVFVGTPRSFAVTLRYDY